tara:strand:+ start:302 stop:487 length:186 start_codon:yes stop_codon:yes gene_type:complete
MINADCFGWENRSTGKAKDQSFWSEYLVKQRGRLRHFLSVFIEVLQLNWPKLIEYYDEKKS